MIEKRKDKRYEISLMVDISFEKFKEVNYTSGINISKGGLLCEVNKELPAGTDVYLLIGIPEEEEKVNIEIQARVVRSEITASIDIYKVALEFTFLDERSRSILDAYIDTLEALFRN